MQSSSHLPEPPDSDGAPRVLPCLEPRPRGRPAMAVDARPCSAAPGRTNPRSTRAVRRSGDHIDSRARHTAPSAARDRGRRPALVAADRSDSSLRRPAVGWSARGLPELLPTTALARSLKRNRPLHAKQSQPVERCEAQAFDCMAHQQQGTGIASVRSLLGGAAHGQVHTTACPRRLRL